MKNILIIEDDPAISHGIKILLEEEGYKIDIETDGACGQDKILTNGFDLVLLDLILPGLNGVEVCRNVRQKGSCVPILMVTSKKDEIDKIIGLEIGADDYITKPFSNKELLARVHAILRRYNFINHGITESILKFDDVTIDFDKHEGYKGKNKLHLSLLEIKLIKYFSEHSDSVISRDTLLDEVWGYSSFPTTRTIDNFILMLRKKIENDYSNPSHLLTVHGVGYKFCK